MIRTCSALCSAMLLMLCTSSPAAAPDLTAGGTPTSTYNLNLGPTGMHGWMYHHQKFDSSESRQILVNSVDSGSPANGVLAAGDVILGLDGTSTNPVNFTSDARKALAQAIADAEARNPATMKLIRWRAGSTTIVEITLRTMGSYSATAPYNCPKSAKILEEGLEYSMNNETEGRYAFRALALLAGKDPANPKNAARQAQAQADIMSIMPDATELTSMTSGVVETNSKIAWKRGHQLVVLAEYYLATGDTTVLPAIEAHAISIAQGQSMFGTVGHQFALQLNEGEFQGPYAVGYGPVNNAGMPCFLGLLLAKECGLTIPELDPAIERASRFFAYYAGRGTIPYGEHAPVEKSFENNGKSGLAALAFSLQPTRQNEADFYARMATAAFGDRQGGHTGSYFNELWAPLGANVAGEDAAAAHFSHISWLLDLNRRWDGGFEWNTLGGDASKASGTEGWNQFYMSTAALLTYALPLRQLHVTGRGHDPADWLNATELTDTVFAGEYDATTRNTSELLADLANWAPAVQLAAAKEIGARTAEHASLLPTLTTMANDTGGTSRVGACRALGEIADDSSAPVLAALLTDEDSEVRRVAANAMRFLGDSAKLAEVNTVLAAAVSTSTPLLPLDEEDPLHFGHYNLCMLLFYPGSALGPQGMIKTSNVDTIDRNFLYPAIRAVAAHPVGLARNTLKNIFASLNETDLLALADVVVDTAHIKAPADAMFGDAVRVSSIEAMRNHGFAEGVPLSKIVIEGEQYVAAAYDAIAQLQLYAGSSKTVRPDPDILGFCENLIEINKMTPEAQAVIDAILADPNPTPLNTFKVVQSVTADSPTLTLPLNSTTLRATTFDYAMGEGAYYTWRKVHGQGNASFSANGTAAAIHTTVTIDPVPGQYLFEVTMSDARGFTETSGTVAVTLRDFGGNLPPNDPPVAYSQTLTVSPFLSTSIYLTGSDPEGLGLTYRVITNPVHGTLSGSGSDWVYAPFVPHPGTDSLTFEVMDSEGQTASATINLTVVPDPEGDVANAIQWDTVADITNANDVDSTGMLVAAWTSADNTGDIVVNGVTFSQGRLPLKRNQTPSQLSPTSPSWWPQTMTQTGTGEANETYFQLLKSFTQNFKPNAGSGAIELNGLIPGRRYLVQLWHCETSPVRQTVLTDPTDINNTATLDSKGGSNNGQHVTGTFIASQDGRQWIYGDGYQWDGSKWVLQSAVISAMQVRLLPGENEAQAPLPDPLTWSTAPFAVGPDRIAMTATPASDVSGVEYYFTCTAGGGNDSGWQGSPSYTDTALTPGVQYSYTVKARDLSANLNETAESAVASATIPAYAAVPDVTGLAQATAESNITAAGFTNGTVTLISDEVIPAGSVISQLPAGGASVPLGAAVDLLVSSGPDVTAPTLIAADIVDDRSGAPLRPGALLTYTVSFSEDINASTLDSNDFGNAGDAEITLGAITETAPGVFWVKVTPTTPGNLQLQVIADAVVTDAVGIPLDTTSAIADDTILAVNAAPVWAANPVLETDATAGIAYASSLADDASDPSGDPLSFAKVDGPGWLVVAPNGALSGTPTLSDTGANVFTVSVSDGIGGGLEATLNITVQEASEIAYMTITNLGGNAVGDNAPATDIFYSQPSPAASSSNLSLRHDATVYGELGSIFTTPDTGDANTQWGLNAITVQSRVDSGYNQNTPQSITLKIYSWQAGESATNVNGQDQVIFTATGLLPAGADIANYEFFEFDLGATVALKKNTTYGFRLSFDDPTAGNWQLNTTNADTYPGLTWTNNGTSNGSVSSRDLYFYLEGVPSTDSSPPSWMTGFPKADTMTADGFTVRAKADELSTAYYVVLANGAAAPTAAQMKAGTDAGGGAAMNGSMVLTANAVGTSTVTGLASGTPYDVYLVAEDAEGNLQTSPVLVEVSTFSPNSAPAWTAVPVNEFDATEGSAYTSTLADDASDANSDPLSFAKLSGPPWLEVAVNGTLSGTPTNGNVGLNTFTVSVSDGKADPVIATLNITVLNTNDAPVFSENPITGGAATEDEIYGDTILDLATDDDGDPLAYAKVAGPDWLTVESEGELAGRISGTPTNADVGLNTFTVSVSDGIAPPVEATLQITVINTNDAPVFTVDPITGGDATEDAAYSALISGSATDDDGDLLTYTKVNGPGWLSVDPDGTLSGTPANGNAGPNVFTVSVSDGIAAPVQATLDITVINSAPQLPLAVTGMSRNSNGDLILDFTGPANSTFQVRKSLDLSVLPFPTVITAQNAPVTTTAEGIGQVIIDAADASEPKAFFQIVKP